MEEPPRTFNSKLPANGLPDRAFVSSDFRLQTKRLSHLLDTHRPWIETKVERDPSQSGLFVVVLNGHFTLFGSECALREVSPVANCVGISTKRRP
jgi:hypothetical protein